MTLRMLVLDDGEVPTTELCAVWRRAGADVVRVLNFFEAQLLLDSHRFDVLVGHEIFLMLAAQMKLSGRRCLLAAQPAEWTPAQLAIMGASAIVSESMEPAELLRAVGL